MTWTLQPRLNPRPQTRYWTGRDLTTDLDKAKTFNDYHAAARHLTTHKHLRPFLAIIPVEEVMVKVAK